MIRNLFIFLCIKKPIYFFMYKLFSGFKIEKDWKDYQ